jgi:hypothetical protein
MDQSLFYWEFKDIERSSKGGGQLASFILASCFIDALAGFYAGVFQKEITTKKQTIEKREFIINDKGEEEESRSGKRYTTFVARYLSQYKPDNLYKDLRCGLVHAYATGQSYVFSDDTNQSLFHMDNTLDGQIILKLEDFLADIRIAYRQYRKDIIDSNDLFIKAKRRYESMLLMGPVKIIPVLSGSNNA